MSIHYRPQRSCGQGNIFTPVCHSVHRAGSLPQCMLGYHHPPRSRHPPQEQTPPLGADTTPPGPDTPPEQTPPEQTPPWEQRHPPGSRLQHTVYERPVRILLECILVVKLFSFQIHSLHLKIDYLSCCFCSPCFFSLHVLQSSF